MSYVRNADLHLPSNYTMRRDNEYYEDQVDPPEGAVWQPDVYNFAVHLAEGMGAPRIVDLGCGNGTKLAAIDASFERIGVDFRINLEAARNAHPGVMWREQNLESDLSALAPVVDGALIIHSDVIEHLRNPDQLLDFFRSVIDSVYGIVISTPDRDRARGPEDLGPPGNVAHVMEWNRTEFNALLRAHGLPPLLHGFTRNFSLQDTRTTQVAFIPGGRSGLLNRAALVSVMALVPCYNERDIIATTVDRLRSQGIDVSIVDNWSDDGTWELISERYAEDDRVTCSRYPGSVGEAGWEGLLDHLDQLAAASQHDWIIRVDADEQFEGFSNEISLRESISIADAAGYDALDATIIDFRPTSHDRHADASGTVWQLPTRWQFALRPGAWNCQRAWKNRGDRVGFASSGGHVLAVEARVFPINLLLRHYPLRNPDQAQRKIFRERRVRWGAERAEKGWHIHYDAYHEGLEFLWSAEDLHEWSWQTQTEWLVELATRQGLTAQNYALPLGVQ